MERTKKPRRDTQIDNEASLQFSQDLSSRHFAKILKVPIMSVVDHPQINMDVKKAAAQTSMTSMFTSVFGGSATTTTTLKSRIIKSKVRVKGVFELINKMATPDKGFPKALYKFLKPMVSDGAYFPPNVLTGFEKQRLEFTQIGSTYNMNAAIEGRGEVRRWGGGGGGTGGCLNLRSVSLRLTQFAPIAI